MCLAAGDECPLGNTCSCEENRVYDETLGKCVCDAKNGYYPYDSGCSKCEDCLTEDGLQCIAGYEMYRQMKGFKQCCSSDDATCKCTGGKINVGGVCECPELLDESSGSCVNKSSCISGKYSIIGSRCLEGDCSTNIMEPSCTAPSGFV